MTFSLMFSVINLLLAFSVSAFTAEFYFIFPLAHGETAVHRDGLTGHIARRIAAKPQNGVGNLFRAANTAHRHGLVHSLESFTLTRGDHLIGHRCPDKARAYRIDTDSLFRIFKSGALCKPKHAVLGGVVNASFGAAHQPAERRTIDDGACSLLAHLLELELHATPDATEIDPHHPVVIFAGRVGRFREDILDAGIVIGHIDPAEGLDCFLHHRRHLR